MKKASLVFSAILGVSVVLLGLSSFLTRNDQSEPTKIMEKTETRETSQTMMPQTLPTGTDEAQISGEGKYIPFSSETLTNAETPRRVFFFYANWCPTCKPADESFSKSMNLIPADTTVIRVNYNDTETEQAEKDLAKKYGVTYQHTFVQIDSQGNEITKWNGGQIEEFLRKIQ